MQPRQITSTTLVVLAALLTGCATHRVEPGQDDVEKSIDVSDMTRANPHLDHIFAWIPRDRAQTASVAEALVYIELGRAKAVLMRGALPSKSPSPPRPQMANIK